MSYDKPKHAGDFCPKCNRPVKWVPAGPSRWALSCERCGGFWRGGDDTRPSGPEKPK
jgi:hypothetical protein